MQCKEITFHYMCEDVECQPLGVPGSNRTHDKVPKAVQKARAVGRPVGN